MKLSAPYKGADSAHISQHFKTGVHPALDMVQESKTYGYGTPLCAPENCEVLFFEESKLTPDVDGYITKGRGIFMKGLETGQVHLYWHTLPVFPVRVGDLVRRGQIVAYMGNAGLVYSNNVYVPIAERRTTFRGTHLHWEVYSPEYRLGGAKPFVNFEDQVDWTLQPTYGNKEIITATTAVLGKISKIIST